MHPGVFVILVILFLAMLGPRGTNDGPPSASRGGSTSVSPDAGGRNTGRVGQAAPPVRASPRPERVLAPVREKRSREAKGDYTDAIWKVESSAGSGTAFVVGQTFQGNTLLVTAAHCVSDPQRRYKLTGGMDGCISSYAPVKVVVLDVERDVALIEAPRVAPYRAIAINQWVNGKLGEEIRIAGYGGGRFSEHYATIVAGKRVPNETLGTKGLAPEAWSTGYVAIPGHSGSPAIDAEERLVGILCAGGGGSNLVVHVRYVRWLLRGTPYREIVDQRLPGESTVATH